MKFNLTVRKLRIALGGYLISFFRQDFDPGLGDIFEKHFTIRRGTKRVKDTYFDICTCKWFELLKTTFCSRPSMSSCVAWHLELIGGARAVRGTG